jgi:hypothetical protein
VDGLEERALLSVLTVTNNSDDGSGSLRQRIAAAQPGDVIQFSPLLDGDTITLTSGEIVPQCSLTIQGPGPNLLTISGNNSSRIFDVHSVSLSISGLTLGNGQSPSGSAISVDDPTQSLSVSHCDFGNNVAGDANGYFNACGGAIASVGAVTIDQCDFTGNLANAASGSIVGSPGGNACGGAIWVDD